MTVLINKFQLKRVDASRHTFECELCFGIELNWHIVWKGGVCRLTRECVCREEEQEKRSALLGSPPSWGTCTWCYLLCRRLFIANVHKAYSLFLMHTKLSYHYIHLFSLIMKTMIIHLLLTWPCSLIMWHHLINPCSWWHTSHRSTSLLVMHGWWNTLLFICHWCTRHSTTDNPHSHFMPAMIQTSIIISNITLYIL